MSSSCTSYTCCDMGLFDFFKRSSSRARSKTASNVMSATATATISTTITTTETASLVADVSMVSVESASMSSESAAVAATTASASTETTRRSLPAAPAKESLDSTATTASSSSNNDDSDPFDNAAVAEASGSQGSIQNYEVVRELGRGATAVVQLGRHKDSAQLVALKVFKTSLLKKMREIKRVGRKMVVSTALDKVQVEIAIMKKLQHRNLLNLLEVFDDDTETLVLLLEYAPHGQIMQWDAAQRVYRANPAALKTSKETANGVFDEAALRPCVRQLLLGLEYLHNNDICHRDLKPENILLGADGVYKIADFGVAHLFEEEKQAREAAAANGGGNNQTATAPDSAAAPAKKRGMVSSTAGTYAFMAPETLKGQAYSAYDADVWALGITIYALAFGKIPYYHPDVVELFELIETQPLELGDNNNSDSSVSDGLAALLRGMLDKDPAQRWSLQQCKQHAWLLEDLDEAQQHEFLNVQHEQVTVSEEDVARAVTRVTSFNVLMRVQLGANKWKRKAMKSLDAKKRASLSGAPPTIDELEGPGDASRLSTASSLSDRSSFHHEQAVALQAKTAATSTSSNAPSDNQQEL